MVISLLLPVIPRNDYDAIEAEIAGMITGRLMNICHCLLNFQVTRWMECLLNSKEPENSGYFQSRAEPGYVKANHNKDHKSHSLPKSWKSTGSHWNFRWNNSKGYWNINLMDGLKQVSAADRAKNCWFFHPTLCEDLPISSTNYPVRTHWTTD